MYVLSFLNQLILLGGSQNDEEHGETCTAMHRSGGRPHHRARRPAHHRRHSRGHPNPRIRPLGRQRTLFKAAGQHREVLPSSRSRCQRGQRTSEPTSKELGLPSSASKLPDLKHLGPCQSLPCRRQCRYWHRERHFQTNCQHARCSRWAKFKVVLPTFNCAWVVHFPIWHKLGMSSTDAAVVVFSFSCGTRGSQIIIHTTQAH